jgi:hypothetical protein
MNKLILKIAKSRYEYMVLFFKKFWQEAKGLE